jgi:hypothetical protein
MMKRLREGLALLCIAAVVALVGLALGGANLAYIAAVALGIGGLVAIAVELARPPARR